MFVIVPTTAHVSIITLLLNVPRHVSTSLHHPQGAHNLCQLKLHIIKMTKYVTSACRYGKVVGKYGPIYN